ncbi:MAG: hypothetical protein DMG89_20445 [Acidobacteria bacterium]|nr:MAG: hypothetical protein DMG89_20445 [Acidobacteriota bacterium]
MESENRKIASAHVGLCANCFYVRLIKSERGSTFYLCARSRTDPSFPKYPRLPVIKCAGYQRETESNSEN